MGIGCLVDHDQRSPVFCAVVFSQVYKISVSFGSALLRLVLDISALLCYYAHSNICKYMVRLNTNVSLLLFCMCLLSQVLVFDPSEWDVSSRGLRREQCQLGTWCLIFTWQCPSCPEGRCCSCFYSAAWCSPLWQTVSNFIHL